MSLEQDIWGSWVLGPRYSSDQEQQLALEEFRTPQAEKILQRAHIEPGDTVLDTGCGDGLLGFMAAKQVKSEGKIVFADVSPDLLTYCRKRTQHEYVTQYDFLHAPMDDLSLVPDSSIDVVVSRAAINFVKDRQKAFSEFHRVLRPGGRLSLLQMINRTFHSRQPHTFLDYDVEPIADITNKLYEAMFLTPERRSNMEQLADFDEGDLFTYAGDAGFSERHLELTVDIARGAWLTSWAAFTGWAPNPYVPTFGEVIETALTPTEAETLTRYLRPKIDQRDGTIHRAEALIWAVKD